MKCPKCQFENPEGSKFCLECGSKIEFRCPQCGNSLPSNAKFCNECGYKLTEHKEPLPVDYSKPQSYTPKHLKEKILTTRSSIEGERKLVTVFFADVANYTSISEKLDPEEIHQIMDGCFKILMDEIHKYEGTINQFTGDGVMALFGAPVAHEDHAQRACYAALSIQKALKDYGEKIKKDIGQDFQMRIGLNSGSVIVGAIGDDLRMDYTAVGDTTNLAQRMESVAKPGSILVSKNTQRIVRHYFKFNALDKLKVKGRGEPQEAFELLAPSEIETRFQVSVSKGLTRFIGRKNSMAILMEIHEKVQSGSGQVVGVVGEAGVGKTRLIMEFISRLDPGSYACIQGQCIHFGESILYLPILDIIKTYFKIEDGDREFIIKKKIKEKVLDLDKSLKHTIPSFQELLSLKADDEAYSQLEPQPKREKTFEATRDLLIRESQNNALILVVEDLHWIDKTSEDFLDYLIEWLANARILLILLYRPEYRHPWGNKTYYTRIGLDHLGTESSTELVKAMLEGGEVAPELRNLILERSAGNPLFMEEFTHTLIENGSIEKKDRQYVLSRKLSDIEVPDTIQGIIAARIDRLEENLKRTMQVASVIGRDFAFRILQTITGMRDELKSYLLNLQGLEFIYEKSLFPELEYIFKHALIRDVAYNSLLQKRKQDIHEDIGKAIENIYTDRIEKFYEMLAYHYSESNHWEKAFQYLKLSGEKAVRNYSNQEALVFYRQAIMMVDKQPASVENKKKVIEVIRQMITPMLYLSFPDDSLQILEKGERLSVEVGDEKALSYFYARISTLYTVKGESQAALNYGEKAFDQAEKSMDMEVMAQTSSAILPTYLSQGQMHKLIGKTSRLISLIEETQRQKDFFNLPMNPYCYCCAYCGSALGYTGNFNEGHIYLEKGLSQAKETGHLTTLGLTEVLYGIYWFLKGDGKKTIEFCQESIRHFEEAEFPLLLGIAWTGSGAGHYLLGDFDTARDHCQKGHEIQSQSGAVFVLSFPYIVLAMVEYDSGNLREAQSCCEKALKMSQEYNERYFEAYSSCILGFILSEINSEAISRAEKLIRKGVGIASDLKLNFFISIGYLYLGECLVKAGQKDKAIENLKTAEEMYKEMGIEFYLARIQTIYADLYKKEENHLKAKERLNKAIEIFQKIEADGWVEKYEKELAEFS